MYDRTGQFFVVKGENCTIYRSHINPRARSTVNDYLEEINMILLRIWALNNLLRVEEDKLQVNHLLYDTNCCVEASVYNYTWTQNTCQLT